MSIPIRPIGQRFLYHGVKLETKEGSSCDNCYFYDYEEDECLKLAGDVGICLSNLRPDGKAVFFEKITD